MTNLSNECATPFLGLCAIGFERSAFQILSDGGIKVTFLWLLLRRGFRRCGRRLWLARGSVVVVGLRGGIIRCPLPIAVV